MVRRPETEDAQGTSGSGDRPTESPSARAYRKKATKGPMPNKRAKPHTLLTRGSLRMDGQRQAADRRRAVIVESESSDSDDQTTLAERTKH